MGPNTFQDIKITGFDKDSSYNPDSKKKVFNLYFQLSESPSYEWEMIFDREREFVRHPRWTKAYVSGRHIVVEAPLEDVDLQLQLLKESIEDTNQKYRQWLQKKAEQQKRQEEEENRQRKDLDDLAKRLKFDE